MYRQPIITPTYYEYNSYPNSYPISYNSDRVYPSYPYVQSINVNAGGPFLGQTQPRDAETNSESHSIVSEVNDLSSNQKREADLTQLNNAEQNEIIQQQMEKTRVIKEASADIIKIEDTK
jgi:hypothetical protein